MLIVLAGLALAALAALALALAVGSVAVDLGRHRCAGWRGTPTPAAAIVRDLRLPRALAAFAAAACWRWPAR